MNIGKWNALLYLSCISMIVFGKYFQLPFLTLLGLVAVVTLTGSIIFDRTAYFIDWFDEALQEWKNEL